MSNPMSQSILPAIFLMIFFIFPIAHASHSEEEIDKLQQKYQDTTSISFDFWQQTSTSGRLREARGNALFVRQIDKTSEPSNSPVINIIRWNYISPSKQIILNDGKELSLYTAEDKQLIVTSSDQLESDITYGIFSGTINILDVFAVSQNSGIQSSDPATQELTLLPKQPHAQIQRLHLWYNTEYVITKLLMEDHFGSVTTLVFSNITLDTIRPDDRKLLSSVLNLDLPEDTEIIRQ